MKKRKLIFLITACLVLFVSILAVYFFLKYYRVSRAQTSRGETIHSIQKGNKTKIVKLSNGKQVRFLSMGPFSFKNGDPPALVLKYETEIELSDLESLRSEVSEVWENFRHTADKSGFTIAAIRAQRPMKGNVIRKGQGYGFVFFKQKDGSWRMKQ